MIRKALLLLCLANGLARAVDRDLTTVTVSNTTTDTSIYSFTVPANLFSNSRGVRIKVWGTYTNNHFVLLIGQNHTLRTQLKFGGTSILDKTTRVIAANAATGAFVMEFLILNSGSLTNQQASFSLQTARGGARLVPLVQTTTASAIDTTVAQTIDVSVQHDAANANLTLVKEGAYAELL